jgi:hypothetical protein
MVLIIWQWTLELELELALVSICMGFLINWVFGAPVWDF